jgi:hypothetical protein
MNTATMKNWSTTSDQDGFKPQEIVRYQLQGRIYGDSSGRFQDGDCIRSSTLQGVFDRGDHKVVITKNTEYAIYPADVDPAFEKQFPGAYDRLPTQRTTE